MTVLSEDQELRDFIDSRDSLLCVFTKRDLERFDKLTSPGRENRILSRNIDRLVVLSVKRAGLTAFPGGSGVDRDANISFVSLNHLPYTYCDDSWIDRTRPVGENDRL